MAQSCSKCGTPTAPNPNNAPSNQAQANDVLAETLYSPQRVEGAMTRRLYPRVSRGKPLWVDIDDAKSRPDLFRIIAQRPEAIAPDAQRVRELTLQAIDRETESKTKDIIDNVEVVPHFHIENLGDKTRKQLMEIAHSMSIPIEATGARGRITREDLIRALA